MFGGRRRPSAGDVVPFNVADKFLHLQRREDWDGIVALRRRGRPPTADDLAGLLDGVTGRIPVLGYRIGGSRWRPHFEPCEVDWRDHVEELRFPAGRSLMSCVQEITERAWPAGRPPWSVLIISGYCEDEYLIGYRVSHVLQDGIATSLTASALFFGGSVPLAGPCRPVHRSVYSDVRTLAQGLRQALPALLLPCARWLPPARRAGTDWQSGQVVLDRALFDEITARTGAAPAQICLAVICGALRDWAPQHWSGPTLGRRQRRGLATGFVMSVRGPRETRSLGSHVGVFGVMLPCAEPSPRRRLQLIVERTDYRVLGAFRALYAKLLRAPGAWGWILAQCTSRLQRSGTGMTLIPSPRDPSAMDAEELLCVPARPPKNDAGFVVVQGPDTITIQAVFRAWVDRAEGMADLLTASLTELHADVMGAAAPAPSAREPAVT
ncbi:wax ester/triacylglycerol synthase domain-containing protein [Streptomyces sp. NPDC101234]|uniref:wax ester/triacylglycerol synthase domain-containing protein n=1 Tax=Streptomyces sp. NPDC101234 TaxID=3366138 RepID=UPI003817F86A